MPHNLFIHLRITRHILVPELANMDTVAMNAFFGTRFVDIFSFFLDKYPGIKLWAHIANAYLIFKKLTAFFQN